MFSFRNLKCKCLFHLNLWIKSVLFVHLTFHQRMQLLIHLHTVAILYQVDKLSNINGRAFAVQITSPEHQLCFSADEQSTIDIFVFLLQSQVMLRETIKG